MKSIALLLCFPLVSGCSAFPRQANAAEATAAEEPQAAETAADAQPQTPAAALQTPKIEQSSLFQAVRTPSQTHGYYFGRNVDPDDDSIMYEATTVYRVEKNEHWNTNPTLPEASFGPTGRFTSAAAQPKALPAEVNQLVERQFKVMAAMAQQIDALNAKLAAPAPATAPGQTPTDTAPATQQTAATSPVPTTPNTAGTVQSQAAQPANPNAPKATEVNIVSPNADNEIALDPRLFESANPAQVSPFFQLYQPRITMRDTKLVVSATVLGPNPAVIINDRAYQIGESIEGLEVHSIDRDGVYLSKATFLLRLIVSSKPVKLKLPQ